MAALLLREDGLEQNVLTLQLTDVLFDPFAFLHGRFVNGQLLVVLQGIQLVGRQLELLSSMEEDFLRLLEFLQQLIRPLGDDPQDRSIPYLALSTFDLLLRKEIGLNRDLMIHPQPSPRTLLQFFPAELHLLSFLLLRVTKGKQIVFAGVVVDEIKALEKLGVAFDITAHDEFNQLRPYLKVAVLLCVVAPGWLVDLVGEGDHLVERAHDIR